MRLLMRLNPLPRKFSHHLLLWCVICVLVFVGGLPHSVAAFKRVSHGDQMIDFKLKDTTGGEIAMNNYRGKTVAVLFFKYPCKRCDMAMRTLQRLYNQYSTEKGMELIAVYCPQTDEKIKPDEIKAIDQIMVDGGYTFPVLLDEGLNVFSKVGVITLPSLAIVDTKGILVDDQPGYPKLNGDKLVTEKVRVALGFPPTPKKVASRSYKPKGQAAKHLKFGRQMFAKGFLGKAQQKLKASVAEDPNFAPPHALLAKIYERQKKYDKALVEHNNAIALKPEDFNLHREYAFYLLRRNQLAESKLEFEVVLELAPNSGDGYFGLGLVYLAQDDEGEALNNFEKAIAVYKGELGEKKKGSSAKKDDLFASMRKRQASKKVRLNPNEAQVHVELAALIKKKGNLEQANEELLKAIAKYRKIIDKLMQGQGGSR